MLQAPAAYFDIVRLQDICNVSERSIRTLQQRRRGQLEDKHRSHSYYGCNGFGRLSALGRLTIWGKAYYGL